MAHAKVRIRRNMAVDVVLKSIDSNLEHAIDLITNEDMTEVEHEETVNFLKDTRKYVQNLLKAMDRNQKANTSR